jgi:hypothetical protein
MVTEISSTEQIHDEIQVLSVLESIVHIHQERTVKLCKDRTFVQDRFHRSFSEYASFTHFLHCECPLKLLIIHLPHLSKASFSHTNVVRE